MVEQDVWQMYPDTVLHLCPGFFGLLLFLTNLCHLQIHKKYQLEDVMEKTHFIFIVGKGKIKLLGINLT
jgi:hypothetical protein